MGHSLVTIRAVITIAPFFIQNFKRNSFAEIGNDKAIKALHKILGKVVWSRFDLEKIDWQEVRATIENNDKGKLKSLISRNKSKKLSNKKKEKGKEKAKKNARKEDLSESDYEERGLKRHQADFIDTIQSILEEIKQYNSQVIKKSELINQDIWACVCKRMIRKNDILNLGSQPELIVYRRFVANLSELSGAFAKEREFNFKTPVNQHKFKLLKSRYRQIFLNFLNELHAFNKCHEVAIIHNYIHLGVLCLASDALNLSNFAMLFSPALLIGLDFNYPENLIPQATYYMFQDVIYALLEYKQFKNPYSGDQYTSSVPYIGEEDIEALWDNSLPNHLIASLARFVKDVQEVVFPPPSESWKDRAKNYLSRRIRFGRSEKRSENSSVYKEKGLLEKEQDSTENMELLTKKYGEFFEVDSDNESSLDNESTSDNESTKNSSSEERDSNFLVLQKLTLNLAQLKLDPDEIPPSSNRLSSNAQVPVRAEEEEASDKGSRRRVPLGAVVGNSPFLKRDSELSNRKLI